MKITSFALFLLGSTAAFAGALVSKETVAPPPEDAWQFTFSAPGWIPWLEGDTGVNGLVSHVALGPDVTVPKVDMIADLRGEAHKGRWSVLGEFFYMSLSDGIGTNTAVKKIDVQMDQTMGDLSVAWRIIDSPRGYLALVGGVRYTNLFQKVVVQANAQQIDETSTHLVEAVSDRIATALSAAVLRNLIATELSSRVDAAELGHPSTLPIAPLGGRIGERIRARIQPIIDARKAELSAAVQARQQAVGAARVAAQRRVDSIKKDLSKEIARVIEDNLDVRVARLDDWWDPYFGFRGRYELNDKFYVFAKADIGGFGIGADITWTAEAALGWKVSERIFSEIGFRALGVDYEKDGLTYDMITFGPQVNLGIEF